MEIGIVRYLPRIFVSIYIVAMLIATGMYPLKLWIPPSPDSATAYTPYLFVSGPLVWVLAELIYLVTVLLTPVGYITWPTLGPWWGKLLVVGPITLVLGSFQYYFIGVLIKNALIRRYRK